MKQLEIRADILGAVATNCFVLTNKETKESIIVDPADDPAAIKNMLEMAGGKAVAIFLTHGHFDHILAVNDLRDSFGIPVYACLPEQELLEDAEKNLSANFGYSFVTSADRLLTDGEVIRLAGFEIRLLHTPGHTKGSCCYYLPEEGVLISGDTLFEESVGRTDFPGGSMREMKRSIRRLLDALPEETVVYPGHGAATTIDHEKRYNPFG